MLLLSIILADQKLDTAAIVENPNPMVTIGNNSPLCYGSTLNLLSGGGDSYLWSGPNGFTSTLQNPTIPNVTMATAGSYTVKVTNSSGCYTISTPTLVVINPKYKFNETAAICAGDFYIWYGRNITNAGTYTDSHLSKFGCDSIYTLQLTIIQTKQGLCRNYRQSEGFTLIEHFTKKLFETMLNLTK